MKRENVMSVGVIGLMFLGLILCAFGYHQQLLSQRLVGP